MEGDPAKLQEALSSLSQQVYRSPSSTFPRMLPASGTGGFSEPPPPYYIQGVQSHPPNAPSEPQPWSYPAAPKAFNVSDTPTPIIGTQPVPSITRTGLFNSSVQLANSTIYTHYPTRVRCPKCAEEVITRVDHQTGILTHLIVGGACLIGHVPLNS